MGYTRTDWAKRLAERVDLTASLVHLTRGTDDPERSSLDILMKILEEKKLCGSDTSSGFIVGNRKAVCFQDVPLYSAVENVYFEQKMRKANPAWKKRYMATGISFRKEFIFAKGGRPVIYEKTDDAKAFLRADEHWRIVRFDLSDGEAIVDWTHEREWRLPVDESMSFDWSDAYVLVSSQGEYKEFVRRATAKLPGLLEAISGIVTLAPMFF